MYGIEPWNKGLPPEQQPMYKIEPWIKGLSSEKHPMYNKKHTEEAKKKMSKSRKGKPKSKEHKKILYENLENWRRKNPEILRENARKASQKNRARGNKLELKVKKKLDDIYPNEWIHNTDWKKVIGGKIPDFYHFSLPIVIEVNGKYWHSKEITGRTQAEEEQWIIDHYKKHNYDCIVLWEAEINTYGFEQLLIERISSVYLKVDINIVKEEIKC